MKIVLDNGGFRKNIYPISENIGISLYLEPEDRNKLELVSLVESHSSDCNSLHIVEIPDNVNDWRIFVGEGGVELVIYVVDNQLYSKS